MKTLFSFLTLSLFLCIVKTTSAQWIPVQGMDGESVNDIECKDSLIFIGSYNGVQIKPITGGEWTTVSNVNTSALVNSGNYLFAEIGWGNCLRTGDNGQTWDTLSWIENLTAIGSTLFCTQFDWGILAPAVFRSDDNGDSWYKVSQFNSTDAPSGLFTHDSILMTTSYSSRHFYSSDLGSTWDSLYTQGLPPDHWGGMLFHYGSHFWLSSYFGTYRYDQPGHHWELSSPLNFYSFTEYLGNLCAGGESFYRYDSIGQYWTELNTGLSGTNIYGMAVKDTLLFAGTSTAPFFTNPSMNWQSLGEGLHGAYIWSVSAEGNEVLVSSSLGIYRSEDAGTTFTKIVFDSVPWFYQALIKDSVYYGLYHHLWISHDHGITWTKEDQGLPPGSYMGVFGMGSDYLFGIVDAYQDEVYRSPIDPVNWSVVPIPGETEFKHLAVHDSTVLMSRAKGNNASVCISHDNLDTFDTLDFHFYPGTFQAGYKNGYFQIFDYSTVYLSADEGNTWDSLNVSLNPFMYLTGMLIKDGTMLLTGSITEGLHGYIYESFDHGATWTDISDNLSDNNTAFQDVIASNNRIFLSTQHAGLWYRDDLVTSSKETSPKQDFLKVFPSPAHDHIHVNAVCNGPALITIFDIYGNERYSKHSAITAALSTKPFHCRGFQMAFISLNWKLRMVSGWGSLWLESSFSFSSRLFVTFFACPKKVTKEKTAWIFC